MQRYSYKAKIEVSQAAISDLQWWMVSTKDNKGSPVHISPPQTRVTTDSSLIGWGAVCNDIQTGGQWGLSEIPTDNNINYLNLFPNDKFSNSSKLKEFADDNFKFDEDGRKSFQRIENTVGKGEIARYEQFLLFPQCFQKTCTANT